MLTSFTRLVRFLLLAAGVTVSLPLVAGDEVPSREELSYGSVTAIITAIDPPSRSVILQFEDGREEAFVVGDQVKDLSELAEGDKVLAGYARSLGLELRPATEAEIESPLEVTEEVDDPDLAPGVRSVGRTIRAVTTIEVLDRINMTATLKGPLGNYLTIDVKNPELITQVHIGDTVVATFTEAVVMTLEKAE
jgi:hypothetical protein